MEGRSHLSNAASRLEEIRLSAIAVIEDLARKSREFELGELPTALEWYRQKLVEHTYKVLVVGEAKRGKSTFVNALIGQDILPTDVEVATSQVFNIRPSEREAYRLRFEDGSQEEISVADLPRYGSQVELNTLGAPSLDKVIRWVEVDAPVRFLPKEMNILDTPGLGTLHAAHARITHRFVPEADAVIFVLDSGQPLIQVEVEFIDRILEETRNIFFIQTKIDLYNRDHWELIQRRNEELLEQEFGDRLDDAKVWPISSTNLRKAASGDEEIAKHYLAVSRHKELIVALQAFLARVAGWSRSTEAILLAEYHHATSRKTLCGRVAGLAEKSDQERAELRQVAAQRKQQFDDAWGQHGQRHIDLLEAIRRNIVAGRQDFSRMLDPDGDIAVTQEGKIGSLRSIEEVNRCGATMAGEVVVAAVEGWRRVCAEVERRCIETVRPFVQAAEAVTAPLEDPNLYDLVTSKPAAELRSDWRITAGSSFSRFLPTVSVLEAIKLLSSPLGVAWLPASLALAAVGATLLLADTYFKTTHNNRVETAKGELRSHLYNTLEEVRRRYFDADLSTSRPSLVDEYFGTLERNMFAQLQTMAKQKSEESHAELVRLAEAAELDERNREAQVGRARRQLAEWDDLGESISDVLVEIKALQEPATEPFTEQA